MRRLIALALLLVPACQDGPFFGTTRPRHAPDELWVNNSSEPEWIDPGKCADAVGGEIILNMFAGLTQPHPKTLQAMPDVAKSWERSDDGKHWVFHLRETRWSDGTKVTAQDFVRSWIRVLDPKTASKYATFLYPLENGAEFNQGKAKASDVGAVARDELTLEVRLAQPIPYFLDLLAYYVAMPVPTHVIEKLEREGKNPDLWTRPEYIVTNGAYTLAEWKFRQFMLLKKNPYYWDAGRVRLERIRLSEVESYNTTLNLYRAGELDWIGSNSNLPAEFIDHLKTFKDYQVTPYLTVYWYWLNTKKPPLNDVRVRRALSLAIDRQSLVDHVKRSGEIPTADVAPNGLAGYEGPHTPIFDAARARALLAEAGFPGGKGFPEVTLIYNTAEGHKQLAEAMQQMWKRELGISVRLENQEWSVFLRNVEIDNFEMARLGWTGDYPDPYTFLEVFTGTSGNNHSGWASAAYDKLLDEANSLTDTTARMGKLREAESLLADAVPVIPIYVYSRSHTVKPYVMGLWDNFMDRHAFKWMWIDERWYDGTPETPRDNPPPVFE